MSEHAPKNHEHFEGLDELRHEAKALPDAAHAEKLRAGEADPLQALKAQERAKSEARELLDQATKAEKQHNPIEKLQQTHETVEHAPQHGHINKDLKKVTLQRELTQIRRHLSKRERAFSKVIHQPVVRAVSEASSKTISRPSGLLGGGIMAFVGSTGYLLLAKNLGFSRYNYAAFLVLFAAGFALGVFLEFVVWTVTRSRHQAKFH
ncbi:MAG: hypothetical protein U0524_03470 [Candidatus Saccharimonadales bacterium]